MCEMFTMQKYMQYDTLKELGINHFVAASFLRLYFIIFSSAVSLLRKNARKPPYPHKTFNYIVLGGNPYTHYFCDVFP